MQIDGYKCPNCAGTVKFDSGAQKMKCPFCDTEFEIEALEEYQKEFVAENKDNFEWGARTNETMEASDDLASGNCPNCAAEIFGDKNTVATVCPCCGNAQIVSGRLSGMLRPNYVIPFKLEKDSAIEALKKFCKGKRLLPNDYLEEKRVKDMQGLYAPFWLFDADANGHISYKATRVKTWSDRSYMYTRTDFYSVVREGDARFEKIPVDGSEKLDDSYMDSIEPFNYDEMQTFNPSFLAGYLAEKYDVDSNASHERAERRIKGTIEAEFLKSVTGYTTVSTERSAIKVKEGKVSYGLFPVWVFNAKYRDENYQFMMNGQTGTLAGRLPIDRGKAWKYRALFFGVFGIIFSALMYLFGMSDTNVYDLQVPLLNLMIGAWVAAILPSVLIVHNWKKKMDTAHLKTSATEYMVKDSLNYKLQKDRFLYSRTQRVAIPKANAAGGRRR